MGGWANPAEDPNWAGIEGETPEGETPEGETPEAVTSAGRSRRPTAYGLPPVTQRSSDLRATISDVLTTKAPAPLIRLANRVTEHTEPHTEVENMTESNPPSGPEGTESPATEPVPSGPSPVEKLTKLTSDRPELVIGAAFVGGLLLATILKRLARR